MAGAVNAARQELAITTGGTSPAWLVLARGGTRIRLQYRLAMQPVGEVLSADGARAYLVGNTPAGGGRLLVLDTGNGQQLAQRQLAGSVSAVARLAAGELAVGLTRPPSLVLLDSVSLRPRGRVGLAAPPRQIIGLPYGHKAFALCTDTVAALDTRAPGLLTYLRLGADPRQMALKPDGGELYISNAGGSVSVINTSTNEVSGTIPAGLGAGALAVAADGSALYVANEAAGTVSVVSLADRSLLALVRVGQHPSALALDRAGLLFVSDTGSDDIAVIRTQDPRNPDTLITLLPSPPHPGFLTVVQP